MDDQEVVRRRLLDVCVRDPDTRSEKSDAKRALQVSHFLPPRESRDARASDAARRLETA